VACGAGSATGAAAAVTVKSACAFDRVVLLSGSCSVVLLWMRWAGYAAWGMAMGPWLTVWGVENRSLVETHVNHAMVDLDARDRARLVVLAYHTGLVIVGEP